MDKYRIDSHKLFYHVSRLNDWLSGKTIYPIYMEISPAGSCNHRCIFCGLDFMEYQNRVLDTSVLQERLTELGTLGLKSAMYAGEGEPLLHRDITGIISHTEKSGIDVAMTTNAVLLKESRVEAILGKIKWIKVSINAGTPGTYSAIHCTRKADFDKVIQNMSGAVHIRGKRGYQCSLGMQMLLLPENRDEAVILAQIARDIGMDYLVIKPYSQHLLSKTKKYHGITYSDNLYLADELNQFNTDSFSVIFRAHTMERWDKVKKPYNRCLALPFWSYIDAGGGVWGCSAYLGDDRFYYGNIYESSFKNIWEGERRLQSLRWVHDKLDVTQCRINCRMDEINRYLWELKNSPAHVNFI